MWAGYSGQRHQMCRFYFRFVGKWKLRLPCSTSTFSNDMKALMSKQQAQRWCNASPLGDEAVMVQCSLYIFSLYSPLCPFFLLSPPFSLLVTVFFPFVYFFQCCLFNGCLDEIQTPGRQHSSTVELLGGGRKRQSCNNNVPLNILDTIYF